MTPQRKICFISRDFDNSLEIIARRESLLLEYFGETFKEIVFVDVSRVFTSKFVCPQEINTKAHQLFPKKFKMIVPESLQEFKRFLQSEPWVVISYFSEEWYDWYIHACLKKFSIPMIYIHTMSEINNFDQALPESIKVFWGQRLLERLKFYARKVSGFAVSNWICAPIDIFFLSNKLLAERLKSSRLARRYKEIVTTNSRFYDTFLKNNLKVSED